MHALPPRPEHRGDRVLREPVDLKVGVELSELVCDGGVALRVPEPDRGRDVEGALPTRSAAHPATRRHRGRDEIAQEQIDLHRIADVREVAASLERYEAASGRFGECCPARMWSDGIRVTVDDQDGAPHSAAEICDVLLAQEAIHRRSDQRLGVSLQRPTDDVLDLLRRVGFVQTLPNEPVDEAGVIARASSGC